MYMLGPLSFSFFRVFLSPPEQVFYSRSLFSISAFVVQEEWWEFLCYPEILFLFLRSSLLELGILPFTHTSCSW